MPGDWKHGPEMVKAVHLRLYPGRGKRFVTRKNVFEEKKYPGKSLRLIC